MFRVNILNSKFSFGLLTSMDLWDDNDNNAEIVIENGIFSDNIVKVGGGVYIVSYGNSHIDFSNCSTYKNIAQQYGGGVYIVSHWNSSINFYNCSIYNNTVLYFGSRGGVHIHSNEESGSIKFHNCSIFNNIAHYDGGGGGVGIYLSGGGSIKFSNSIIYNNIAHSGGGGVEIDLYEGSGKIEIDNCNNTAQFDEGRVYIALYESS